VNPKKVLITIAAAMVLLVSGGVAYAAQSPSEKTATQPDDDGEDTYRGSVAVSAPDQSGSSSLQELAKVDRAAAERAALEAVPGTIHETELETSDNGYVVYDIELVGNDGQSHEVKVDAGNGEILHQGLEESSDEADGAADTERDDTEDADGPGETEDAD
jgi:uncharacterized membrane protein YkoI